MVRVLIITGILPVSAIEHKKRENDILLVTEDEIITRYPSFSFKYIFVFPYANKPLASLTTKWKSYFELSKKTTFNLRGRSLTLLPVLLLPKKVFFRNILLRISLYVHRKRIDELIKDFKPTVLHAQNADSDAFIARKLSKKYNIPFIVTLRGLNSDPDSKIKNNLKKANSLIAISSKQITDGKKLVNKDIIFVPHGVKDSFYQNNLKREFSAYKIRLITVSRLLKLKNIDIVIRCLSEVKFDYIFDIYGEGTEYKNLESLIIKLGLEHKIRLQGFLENNELPNKFQEYDLFVMPSYPESLGRVYFEAMASGLPVIASKNTGIDGIIRNGIEGFIINHQEENEMATILDLIGNKPEILKELGRNARQLAQNYKWENISKMYYDLYKQ